MRLQADDESGASAVEYAILVAAIAAVIVLVVGTIGVVVYGQYSDTEGCIAAEASSTC